MRPSAVFPAWLGAAAIALALAAPLPAAAAVDSPQQVLTVQQFLAHPGELLKQFPNGGDEMVAAVRSLATSDPATLNALIGLLGQANDAQASAIGKALGDVAKADVGTNPDYAAQIQVAVVIANNNTALVAFNAVIGGDIQLSAVTGGGGGGGGGGPTGSNEGNVGNSTSLSLSLTTSTTNTPDSFSPTTFNSISISVSQ